MNVSIKFSGVFTQKPNSAEKSKSFHLRNTEYWVTNDRQGKDLAKFDELSLEKKNAEEQANLARYQKTLNESKYDVEKKNILSKYVKGLAELAQKAQII
jgi:hypothetical protein